MNPATAQQLDLGGQSAGRESATDKPASDKPIAEATTLPDWGALTEGAERGVRAGF